jgi:hypothetical protein
MNGGSPSSNDGDSASSLNALENNPLTFALIAFIFFVPVFSGVIAYG